MSEKQKKRCRYCEKWYPETDFGVALTTEKKVYRRQKCRYCYRETKRALIQKYQRWLNEYKQERGCFRCGISDYRVLDFHHKDEGSKEFNLGYYRRRVSFEKIMEEVAKCDVVCANCHRIMHDELRNKVNN